MPTYNYECTKCGASHEAFLTMSEKHPKKCPACGKKKLEKIIVPGAGVRFIGPGFHVNDYGKGPSVP